MSPAAFRFAVAPMMDWTDRHCRFFLRQLSRHTLLYTEMVTTGALLHGNAARFLDHSPAEQPLALQLGGSDPDDMASAAALGAAAGYVEINMNVGCPSDRVQAGRFGACLMKEPALVGACVAAMRAAVKVPITVKTRLGVDDDDSYEQLHRFTGTVMAAGCDRLIVHARKAWLQGLSPKQNREIPPLDYERVNRLKHDFPALDIVLNGGITSLAAARYALNTVDGVMVGREAYQNPWLLSGVDRQIFGVTGTATTDRDAVVISMHRYAMEQFEQGVFPKHITRHMLGLFA
ncbi:MAG: tRNA dihydrouridine(20/20a) synthase DusA, partial [Gammaproteobacteria bacterium]|nr:tRNA dihydrouridine(20/20a) synthase DusA [Gammaproteobacteria bacterium]